MKLSIYSKIWGLAFFYTLLIGLFIQLVVLKYIFPQWNAGAGMLEGSDSPYYHGIALSLYDQMMQTGWGAWKLFPDHQIVSGISAIFYYLIAPQPWSVLPLHALLNATACTALFYLLTLISVDQKSSVVAILPFLLFPSALQWNAQLNNDVYSVPGVILFVTGWAALFNSQVIGWRKTILYLIMLVTGFFLTYLVRPYLGLPLTAISIFLFSLDLLLIFLRSHKSKEAGSAWLKRILVLALIVVCLSPFISKGLVVIDKQEKTKHRCVGQVNLKPWCAWQASTWIPEFLDQQIKNLSVSRSTNMRAWKEGVSTIDSEIVLLSTMDVIGYIPRALQISLFAPFPEMWSEKGSQPSNTLMRKIAGAEMLIVYLCLAGLLPGFFFWKQKPAFYVLILICGFFLLLYGMTVPNIGTLYRFRYPFLMCLVSLGLASWLAFYKNVREMRKE